MLELTTEQRRAAKEQEEIPLRALEPDSNTTYVLLREVYARLKRHSKEEQFLDNMYLPVMAVFGKKG